VAERVGDEELDVGDGGGRLDPGNVEVLSRGRHFGAEVVVSFDSDTESFEQKK
jgi:hypothetical protein